MMAVVQTTPVFARLALLFYCLGTMDVLGLVDTMDMGTAGP